MSAKREPRPSNGHTSNAKGELPVVVLTGASSGFGRGIAMALSGKARLILAARRFDELESLADFVNKGHPGTARPVVCDVSDAEQVQNLIRESEQVFGGLDVWINNAGVGAFGKFNDIPLADHEQIIRTNLLGALYGSYEAMRYFRTTGEGLLINIGSEVSVVPVPYHSSYVASKHGVLGLSRSIRQELRLAEIKSIHVCVVMPGEHDTPFFEHAGNYTGKETMPQGARDPQPVIDAVVALLENPKDEVVVASTKESLMVHGHGMMPKTVEKMAAKQTHDEVIESPPPGPKKAGSVREPKPEGRTVRGGFQKP